MRFALHVIYTESNHLDVVDQGLPHARRIGRRARSYVLRMSHRCAPELNGTRTAVRRSAAEASIAGAAKRGSPPSHQAISKPS